MALGLLAGLTFTTVPLTAAEAATASPAPLFSWGTDLRLRNEYFDDIYTFNSSSTRHEQNYQRFRGRLWLSTKPTDTLTLNARLTWESWNWNRDSYKAPYAKGWVVSEGLVDQLNVTWKSPAKLPLDLTLGRQDIILGDGWLVAEGTPLDGSRTIFFDALRGTYKLSAQTTLDGAYLDLSARNQGRLSSINNQNISLAEQDERSGYLYLTNRSLAHTQVDAYFIRRTTTRVLATGDNAHYSILGTRLVATPTKAWLLKGEAAYQFGTKNSHDLRAWGFVGQASWLRQDALNNQFRVTLEALSGDKPGTADDEQFDITWGRYPRWSEIFTMHAGTETRPGQFSNLLRTGPGWSFSPRKGFDIAIDYNVIWALENNRATASGWFSADGGFRGHLARSVIKYKFSPHWAGTLLGEYFKPGSYYGPTRRAASVFFRTELVLTF